MNQRSPIQGKVAAILSARELVISRGANDGVEEGTKFAVLDPSVQEITDPDTGEILGSLKRPKVRVEVISAQDRFSVARTFERIQTGSATGLGGVAAMFQSATQPPTRRYKTLRRDDAAWEELDETKSFVKVGDPVEEIVESATYEEVEDSTREDAISE